MRYEIWTLSPGASALGRRVAHYGNRGHAIAKLRGLRRAARCSEVVYVCVRVAGVGRLVR